MTNLSESQKLHHADSPSSPRCSPDTHSHSPGSWSLKRLLSGRSSRRYRVLEREPNRLRKPVCIRTNDRAGERDSYRDGVMGLKDQLKLMLEEWDLEIPCYATVPGYWFLLI
ncbi:hypothetical protein N7528_003204 [Penicillium herquei]|nr:hypothetical protein N7528_003204 [Penicillium herquei]